MINVTKTNPLLRKPSEGDKYWIQPKSLQISIFLRVFTDTFRASMEQRFQVKYWRTSSCTLKTSCWTFSNRYFLESCCSILTSFVTVLDVNFGFTCVNVFYICWWCCLLFLRSWFVLRFDYYLFYVMVSFYNLSIQNYT